MKEWVGLPVLLFVNLFFASASASDDAWESFSKGPSRMLITEAGTTGLEQLSQEVFSGYDRNWAGAIVESSGVTTVTGTFNVPNVDIPSGDAASGVYGAASWVGIDGKLCKSAILQTGVMYSIHSGQPEYHGWFEWFPNPPGRWTRWSVSPGDQITATVVATSANSGTATLVNDSTGQSVTKTFSGMTDQLCQEDAEWIVEDYQTPNGLIPLANFNTVAFSGAGFSYSGISGGISGANVVNIAQSGAVLTACTVSGSSGLICSYQ